LADRNSLGFWSFVEDFEQTQSGWRATSPHRAITWSWRYPPPRF